MSREHVFVTLVHGTRWLDRLRRRVPPWVENGRLRAALEGPDVTVEAFLWSGGHSYSARARAAAELENFLAEQARRGGRQWIVAHSHGGNVALHAADRLRRLDQSFSDLKVVTLATPFLHARDSPPRSWAKAIALFTVICGGFAVLNALAPMIQLFGWVRVLAWVLAVVFVLHLVLMLVSAVRHGGWLDDARRREFVATIHAPEAEPERTMAVRAASDEASAALGWGQFIAWLGLGATQWMTPRMIIGTAAVGASAAVGILGAVSSDWRIHAVLIAVSFTHLAIVLPALTALLVFGWDGPYGVLFARVSVEAVPPGTPAVWQLQPFAPGRGLAHSKLYSTQEVIDGLVRLVH
ncbi:hypothetical protein [Actinoplanes regularis]|uniref:hypothetical protein n=1 Tax=Actinoplanes regularis TaxID=52697 RepID=UPI0024A44906|nr:hypothetical protein [Actinoplanes regularis]GLW35591.1 hypothetical protein Areg01_85260 [Actinoplanes regularis]